MYLGLLSITTACFYLQENTSFALLKENSQHPAFAIGPWHTPLHTQWEGGTFSHHTLFPHLMMPDYAQFGFSRDGYSAFQCLPLSPLPWFESMFCVITFKCLQAATRGAEKLPACPFTGNVCHRISASPTEERCWHKSLPLVLQGVGICLFSCGYYCSVGFLEQTQQLGSLTRIKGFHWNLLVKHIGQIFILNLVHK